MVKRWLAKTFPTLVAMDGATIMMLPLLLMMIFSIAVGIVSPLVGRLEFGQDINAPEGPPW